ncbi:hypothetical protein HF086_016057, partial [Spodoptera exigua]
MCTDLEDPVGWGRRFCARTKLTVGELKTVRGGGQQDSLFYRNFTTIAVRKKHMSMCLKGKGFNGTHERWNRRQADAMVHEVRAINEHAYNLNGSGYGRQGRGKKVLPYLLPGIFTTVTIVGGMALKTLAAIAGKALIASKVAPDFIAGITALKKLFSHDGAPAETNTFQVHADGHHRRNLYVVRPAKAGAVDPYSHTASGRRRACSPRLHVGEPARGHTVTPPPSNTATTRPDPAHHRLATPSRNTQNNLKTKVLVLRGHPSATQWSSISISNL